MSTILLRKHAWDSVRWPMVRERVRRIQRRIYKAKRLRLVDRVYCLQKRLINSLDAKLLAVHLVTTTNRGKNTAGVDGVKGPFSARQKMALALALRLNGRALPIRRVWIPKPGKNEKRPLGIPIIRDRAKQALAKLALEPEWEAVFEPNSYGFRPGRRTQDAIEAIFLSLRHKTPKWVFDADIRKCFDRIDHDALLTKLNTFPAMEAQVKAWLKADIMEGYADSPKGVVKSLEGTPQGGVVSPLLANIALHGLESHLKDFVTKLPPPRPGVRGSEPKRKALGIARYADDFVVIHENVDILKACVKEAEAWLATMGLELNAEKSAIRNAANGFLFLGFQIIMVKKSSEYKVKITPSKVKRSALLDKVRKVIQLNKSSSAYKLITTLRPIILGWANYYRFCECGDVFGTLTNSIFRLVRAWVFRRDTRNGRETVKERYFPSGKTYKFDGVEHKDNWILYGTEKGPDGKPRAAYLPHISWVRSKKYVKVKEDYSPFDNNHVYWALRLNKYETLPIRVKTLIVRQKGICANCGSRFTNFDTLEVDHIVPTSLGGKNSYDNLQLLHRSCHVKKTSSDGSLSQ